MMANRRFWPICGTDSFNSNVHIAVHAVSYDDLLVSIALLLKPKFTSEQQGIRGTEQA